MNDILPFVTTWMDVEGILLSKSERDRCYIFTYMCDLKTKTNE